MEKEYRKKVCHIYKTRQDMPPGGLHAHALDDYLGFGSVQKAAEINREIFLDPRNKRYIQSLNYKGYEIAWSFYNTIYHNFSLPFTQIELIVQKIKPYEKIVLHGLPHTYANAIKHFFFEKEIEIREDKNILQNIHPKRFLTKLIAGLLGLTAIIFYSFFRKKVALRTSDMIFKGADSDFRLTELYKQMRKENVKFLEFVRLHDLGNVFKNIFVRKRLVIYYQPFTDIISLFTRKKNLIPRSVYNSVLLSHDREMRVIIKALPLFRFVYRRLGIKSLWFNEVSSRTALVAIAAKCSGVKTVGVKSGAGTNSYDVGEFLTGYWSEKKLGPDIFGVWSPWWKEYFKTHSNFIAQDSVKYVGLLRPYSYTQSIPESTAKNFSPDEKIRLLILSEPLTNPAETAPYLKAIAHNNRFSLALKLRPNINDPFYEGLKKIMPEAESWPKYKGDIFKDGKNADVFLGAHTTALLEASLLGKISVFIKTQKWGDYFDLSRLVPEFTLLVDDPGKLAEHIITRLAKESEFKTIERIKYRYFGENKNGAAWAAKELNNVV